ncbi:MAG: hypothetical protein JNK72_06810 [Myxococcales bacterium]|nr:hypothetical protein [Myxococcales bacterium]
MRTLLLALFVLVGGLLFDPAAHAWTSARPAGFVTEYEVDRDGGATATLRVRWRILAGSLHQFDLAELPVDLALLEASAVNAVGAAVPLSTRVVGPGRLEVSLGDDTGVRRGTVDVTIRYTTSLRAQGLIRRAGTDAVVELGAAPWEHGLDAAEMRIALPSSARRAQWLADETAGMESTTTNEVTRDVVRLLRHHVPAGTRWTARVAVDPNLFPWLSNGATRNARPLVAPKKPVAASLITAMAVAAAALTLARRKLSRQGAGPLLNAPRLGWLPGALLVVGAAFQGAAVAGHRHALTVGTLALMLAALAALPRRRALTQIDPSLASHRVDPKKHRPAADRTALALALGVLTAALVAALAVRLRSMPLGVAAIDLALAAMVLVAAATQRKILSEFDTLRSVSGAIEAALRRRPEARLVWRLRGHDPRARGSVRALLTARPGWHLARGLKRVEWAVATHPSTLGWREVARMVVKIEPGAPLERALRQAAIEAGSVKHCDEGATFVYAVDLEGDDRAAALDTLKQLLPMFFVRAEARATRSRHGALSTAHETAARFAHATACGSQLSDG